MLYWCWLPRRGDDGDGDGDDGDGGVGLMVVAIAKQQLSVGTIVMFVFVMAKMGENNGIKGVWNQPCWLVVCEQFQLQSWRQTGNEEVEATLKDDIARFEHSWTIVFSGAIDEVVVVVTCKHLSMNE
jgi:hypothetical protein